MIIVTLDISSSRCGSWLRFSDAHPLHGLSGRWKRHLVQHTEKELQEAAPEEAAELALELEKYWRQHVRCVSAMLPERHEGGVVGCWRDEKLCGGFEWVWWAQETMLVTIPSGARPGDELTITTNTGQDGPAFMM